MTDITPGKWYYSNCNTTSDNVLISLEVEGSAEFDDMANRTHVKDIIMKLQGEDDILENYFESNVCSDMKDFQAFATDRPVVPLQHTNDLSPFRNIEHSLLLLCGGEDFVYYDEEQPDAGFLLFGFMVGFAMVGMIFTELQKYDRRPHPLASRRSRRQEYDSVTFDQEVEMV